MNVSFVGSIFSTESDDYKEFEPIKERLRKGCNSKIVYGGAKYCNELKTATKYSRIFRFFKEDNRIVELDKEIVDKKQEEVMLLVNSLKQQNVIFDDKSRPRFDDSHIVSIAIISKCKLVCTRDQGLHNFIKINLLRKYRFFPKSDDVPLIYSQLSNKDLLCSQNIAHICKKIIN
ncbi:MAG: hypothetical protein QG646_3679 [Euryarchaeota archaeon]|nr:hypothetical protein [Euryarchaeota archaeon]